MTWLWGVLLAALSLLLWTWLSMALVRSAGRAQMWRHKYYAERTLLTELTRQTGWWRCACGQTLAQEPHVCGGIQHAEDACRPLDDCEATP